MSFSIFPIKRILSFSILLLLSQSLFAETMYPAADWEPKLDPVASEDAIPGGKISIWGSQFPKSFNAYLDQIVTNSFVFGNQFETLLTVNSLNMQFEPSLACSWTVSDDKKVFTFTIDNRASWSDGVSISADDVVWTFNAIRDPKNLTGSVKTSLQAIDRVEKLDDKRVRFYAKEVHWRNLLSLGFIEILPKHHWENLDFNKVNFEFPVVSGPYQIKKIIEGKTLVLEKRKDYWNQGDPRLQNVNNFDEIEFRFYPEREMAFEAFKKGEIDVFYVYTSHRWMRQTNGEAFTKNWIQKQLVDNQEPTVFQGFAMNMRRDKFKDLRVRKALAYLLDRKRMNQDLMYNAYTLHQSCMEDLYDKSHPCPNLKFEYDLEKARALLSDAGWAVNKETGKLEKGGQPFVIEFLTRDSTSDKFLVIYKEALDKLGIDLKVDRKDWAAWTRDMDEYNYDMTWASWGGSIWRDPESMWSSKEVDRPSGVNITGFKNKLVDEIIELQKGIFDVQKRNDLLREIDAIIYNEVPYILLWFADEKRVLNWSKFGKPDTVLSRFGGDHSALSYWWYDEDAEAELKQAKEASKALPPVENRIVFDEEFLGEFE